MKAPDKVYLDIIEDDDINMMSPSYEDNGGVEYIRKDALVDWLKRKQDTTLKVVEDDLIQEVIDHINEM